MKFVVYLLLIFAGILIGFTLKTVMANRKVNVRNEMKKPNRQAEEAGIRKTEAAYDLAWKQGDIDGILACFTEDAVLISPRGDVAIGKEQIRLLLSNFLGGEAKSTKHTSQITRILFITNDVAIVDGEAFIKGADHLSASIKKHSFTDVLVRTGNDWRISQIRAYANPNIQY